MIEILIWSISFLSLFLSIFWIQVIYTSKKERKIENINKKITIIVPAYNEEKTIAKTLKSLIDLNYKNKEIIVVSDSSTDNTEKEVKKFKNVILLRNKHTGIGKSSAVNKGLKYATGEFIAVVDADSEIEKESLNYIMHNFEDEAVGAVISTIKVRRLNNVYEKLQRIEYMLASFSRTLMSKIDTLHVTPGALSVYRTHLIKKLGGFDENNLTEDLEIAMRLKYHGYNIKIAEKAVSYTHVPSTFRSLWHQRVRWFRGFIYNTAKYRKMFMSRKHGIMGTFQIPINFTTLIAILLSALIIAYELVRRSIMFINKFSVLKWEVIPINYDLPSIRDLILGLDINIAFPLIIAFLLSVFILHKAHISSNEKWQISPALLIYFTLYPLLRSLHWIVAFSKETTQSRKKW